MLKETSKAMLKLINPVVAKEVGVMAAMVFQHICYWMQTQSVEVVYRSNKELSLDLDEAVSVSQVQRAKQKLLDKGLITLSRNPFNKFDRTTHYSLTSKGKKMLLSVGVKWRQTLEKSKDVLGETVNTVKDCVNNSRTSDSSDVKGVGDTYVPKQPKTSNTRIYEDVDTLHSTSHTCDSDIQQSKKQQWIPKHLYHAHMKQKRLDEQLNKEPFIPKSMIQGWKDGMTGNPNATKGIPEHLLIENPKLAKMLKRKSKNTSNNV